MTDYKKIALLVIVGAFFLSSVALAVTGDYFRLEIIETLNVTAADGHDYKIISTTQNHVYFIPNKTAAEWNSFYAADTRLTDLTVTLEN